jgi:hypothetical protein
LPMNPGARADNGRSVTGSSGKEGNGWHGDVTD